MAFKWKISLLITITLIVILLITNLYVYLRYERTALRGEQDTLEARVSEWANDFRQNPRLEVSGWADDLERDQYITVRNGQGGLLFEKGLHFNKDWIEDPLPPVVNNKINQYTVNGQRILFAEKTIRGSLSGQPVISVTLLESSSQLDRSIRNVRDLLIAGLVGGVCAAAAISFLVASLSIRPVGSLIRKVKEIGVNNLRERLPLPGSRDEIYELAITLNGLLERIDEGFEKQRQFVADASHELRTPLAIIEGHANMMKRWGNRSPEVAEESTEYILQETARLRRLTEQLLQTASLEQGEIRAASGERESAADCSAVLRELCGRAAALLNPEIRLHAFIPEGPIIVDVPEEELKQVLLNIIDNAMKYTPGGGEVTVRLECSDCSAEISVKDTGVGIARSDLPRIFERFYRADKSRSREKGGSGLGLSIVKKTVEKRGGTIHVESAAGAGTTVRISFALSQKALVTEKS